MPVEMKAMIADTLNGLLKQKQLDKITVKELVDACHISRQTFYYHFRDIMDVVEWYQNKTLKKSIESSLTASNCQDAIKGMVQETFQHKELIQHLLSSQRREEMEQLFVKAIRSYLEEMLRQKAPDLALSPADAETILCFYSWGMIGLILASLQQKNPDIDAISQQLYRLLTEQIPFHFTCLI